MAAKVAVPIPPKLNPTIVKEKSPVPTIKVIATTIKLRVVDKSTFTFNPNSGSGSSDKAEYDH